MNELLLLSPIFAQSFSGIASGVAYAQWINSDPNRISAL